MAVKFILESKNKKKDERLGRPSFPPLIGWGRSYINKSVNRNKGACFLLAYQEKKRHSFSRNDAPCSKEDRGHLLRLSYSKRIAFH
jgi:hypothetical protein